MEKERVKKTEKITKSFMEGHLYSMYSVLSAYLHFRIAYHLDVCAWP